MNLATKWGIERDGATSICRDIYIDFQVEYISGFISEMKDPEGQNYRAAPHVVHMPECILQW